MDVLRYNMHNKQQNNKYTILGYRMTSTQNRINVQKQKLKCQLAPVHVCRTVTTRHVTSGVTMAIRLHVGYMQFRGKDSVMVGVDSSPSQSFSIQSLPCNVVGPDALFTLHARPNQAETTVIH